MAKPSIYLQLYESSEASSLNYWLELFLSAGIATLGLVLNSPAVVIGAMLISPLMGPILALGLALAIGDLYLGLRAALLLFGSIVAAVAISALVAWLLPFHTPTPEILARTQPNLLDLGVALVRDETIACAAITEAIRALAPAGMIVSQRTVFTRRRTNTVESAVTRGLSCVPSHQIRNARTVLASIAAALDEREHAIVICRHRR